MTWKQGRRLDTVSQNGMLVSSYKYNDEGIRTSKIECGVEHKYILDGTRIISETWGDVLIVYLYDEAGSPIGMQYRHKNMPEGTFDSFFFEKNIFGDIIAIYDTNGVKQISYTYDAFGKFTKTIHVSGTRADFNYLRYRGYYYDAETGFYYLNSRYYDPVTCRFINADSPFITTATPMSLTDKNLFTYCDNNPVMRVDEDGEFWISAIIVAAVVLLTPVGGIAAQAVTSTVSYGGMAVAAIFDEEIREDMDSIGWNPLNDDETSVINSNKVSFYKGVPVYKTNCERSGSFYAILLKNDADESELKHERGHNTQAMNMGIFNYGFSIGIPSAFELSNRDYYNRPWEITADVFGGVNTRSHDEKDINRGYGYFATAALLGPVSYLFLFGEY